MKQIKKRFVIFKKSIYLRKKMDLFLKEVNEKIRKMNSKFIRPNESNVKFADNPIHLEWGGSSLFNGYLIALNDLHSLKKSNIWNWDYVITMSESDYIIK